MLSGMLFLPTSTSQLHLYCKDGDVDGEGQLMDDIDDSASAPELLPESEKPTPCITTAPTSKKRQVIVTCDSLLKETEHPDRYFC